jgi:hypothetical protein
MRTIREILLTEYIGAIVIAVLVADAFSTLFTTLVAQISYHVHFEKHTSPKFELSTTYPLFSTVTKIGLYLAIAYLLARWLYGRGRPATGNDQALHRER